MAGRKSVWLNDSNSSVQTLRISVHRREVLVADGTRMIAFSSGMYGVTDYEYSFRTGQLISHFILTFQVYVWLG